MQRAAHHDGAGESVVVISWGISVMTHKYVIKDKQQPESFFIKSAS